jgi:hypothetical protein
MLQGANASPDCAEMQAKPCNHCPAADASKSEQPCPDACKAQCAVSPSVALPPAAHSVRPVRLGLAAPARAAPPTLSHPTSSLDRPPKA